MIDETLRTIIIIIVICFIVIGYLTYLGISFYFMRDFKKKIMNQKDRINLIIYQKYQSLDTASTLIIKLGYGTPEIKDFDDADMFKKYVRIEAQNFDKVFGNSENYYRIIKNASINLKTSDNLNEILKNLKIIDGLNSRYYESVQLYNTYVVGFNYWRNLFFTKWFKVLLKKDEIETIR